MGAYDGMMTITTMVTFPDETELSVKMCISHQLYVEDEIPNMVEDTMYRAARALKTRIKERDK